MFINIIFTPSTNTMWFLSVVTVKFIILLAVHSLRLTSSISTTLGAEKAQLTSFQI